VGVLGTVVAGPTYIDGFSWWNINYDSGIDGWSVEDYVTKYVSTTPPPDPSPVPTPPPVPTPSSQLKIGSQVISTNNLKSRFCASIQCRGLGVHKKGEIGEVIDGPQYADNYNWYKIDFQTGVDGWSVENYIAVIKSLVINDRFYTIANLKLRLCPSLSCALISIQKAGLHGVVMDGPVTADNYNWYKIKYDSGLEGWSIGNYLVYE
jgi:uncharacterized protein YgiM (DUF1202 family)